MPRCLIVYFSQGGTTALVSHSIADGLRRAQVQVDLSNLRDVEPPAPTGYDLIGIGSPTYYYRPPFNVMAFLQALPDLAGLPAFAFVLHGTYRGDAGNVLRQALKRKGAQEVGYFHCHGADYALGYLREGYLFSPDNPTAEDLAQAERFGRDVASRLAGQPYAAPESDQKPALIYRVEQLLTNRWLSRVLYSRWFRVHRNKCTACDLCAERCPMGNITQDTQGRPVWGRNCLLCMFCEMVCPEEAITTPSSWLLARLFFRYNVRCASKDPALEYARVKHGKGRTVRL